MAMVPDSVLRRLTALPGALALWSRFPYGSVRTRVRYGIFERPHYAYGMYMAALQASALKIPAISAMEFGVSRGRGLLAMEAAARQVSEATGVRIAVFGFDTGAGMPPPVDYRDVPYIWQQGFYKMDVPKLKSQLRDAELLLGDVGDTVALWLKRADVPPVGFISFDLDYYSSTMRAFELLKGPATHHLPRTYCYLDDTVMPENSAFNEFTGELGAVRDFNLAHQDRKICPVHMLRNMRPNEAYWHDQMYIFHNFHHPRYCDCILPPQQQAFEARQPD